LEELMSKLVTFFETQTEYMLTTLRELVEIESPSHDKAAVDRMGETVGELLKTISARVERLPRERVGDIVLGHWEGGSSARSILLLCHMDTVWPVGTLAKQPIRVEEGRLYGPGAFDMKAGIVIALTALRGLQDLGLRCVAPVAVLCNGDEEIGSRSSRGLIEELAAASGLVICLEPTVPGGALKTFRKGGGSYTVRAKGRAAHAGADHEKGVNAIEEMAHQVLALQALTDYEKGTTVNVGVISGGSATNVVPEECQIRVDVRITSQEEAERIDQVIRTLHPQVPGNKLTVDGGLGRPPMLRDALMVRTFGQVQRIANRHGLTVAEGSTGGGSDGSLAAAMGAPTLDGMGADGDGGHAAHEHVKIASLPTKAALLAAILSEWEFESEE
jgi:glutamate carboxypeptidase